MALDKLPADKSVKQMRTDLQQEASAAWKKLPGAGQATYLDMAKGADKQATEDYTKWLRKLQRQCLIICQKDDTRGAPYTLDSSEHDFKKMKELMGGEGWMVDDHLNVKTADDLQEIFTNFLAGQLYYFSVSRVVCVDADLCCDIVCLCSQACSLPSRTTGSSARMLSSGHSGHDLNRVDKPAGKGSKSKAAKQAYEKDLEGRHPVVCLQPTGKDEELYDLDFDALLDATGINKKASTGSMTIGLIVDGCRTHVGKEPSIEKTPAPECATQLSCSSEKPHATIVLKRALQLLVRHMLPEAASLLLPFAQLARGDKGEPQVGQRATAATTRSDEALMCRPSGVSEEGGSRQRRRSINSSGSRHLLTWIGFCFAFVWTDRGHLGDTCSRR